MMLSKVYAVVEYGGEYEDSWEHIVGVCSTPELADKLKEKIESSHKISDCPIDEDKWNDMWEAVEFDSPDETTEDAMLRFFPEYSKEDIIKAIKLYDDCAGVNIEEIDFYTEQSNF